MNIRSRLSCYLTLIAFALVASGCNERILHDLDELSANQVTVILSQAGIEATKVRDGTVWGIEVASSDSTQALSLLEESRILRRDQSRFQERSKSFIESREERRYFFERNVAWNLEQTLERLGDVREARVHLFMAEDPGLRSLQQKNKGSASILLVVADGSEIDEGSVKKIVSGASGIAEELVSVVVKAQTVESVLPDLPARPVIDYKVSSWRFPSHLKWFGACVLLALAGLFLLRQRRDGRKNQLERSAGRSRVKRVLRPPQNDATTTFSQQTLNGVQNGTNHTSEVF